MNDDLLKAADALRDNCHVLRMRADDAENENAILKAERDALRALLSEHRDFPNAGDAEAFRQWHEDWCARRDAALTNKT